MSSQRHQHEHTFDGNCAISKQERCGALFLNSAASPGEFMVIGKFCFQGDAPATCKQVGVVLKAALESKIISNM